MREMLPDPSHDRGWRRIEEPVCVDDIHTVDMDAQLSEPAAHGLHFGSGLSRQLGRHTGGDHFLYRSNGTVANLSFFHSLFFNVPRPAANVVRPFVAVRAVSQADELQMIEDTTHDVDRCEQNSEDGAHRRPACAALGERIAAATR